MAAILSRERWVKVLSSSNLASSMFHAKVIHFLKESTVCFNCAQYKKEQKLIKYIPFDLISYS